VYCGFDLSRQEYIGAATFNSSMVPVLSEAIRQGRPVHLPGNSNVPDLVGLGNVLHLPLAGPILATPIFDSNRSVNGAVILLSPYTKRTFTASDQNLLAEISRSMTCVFNREQQAHKEAVQLNHTKRALERLQNENQQLALALKQVAISDTDQPNSVEELQSELHLALAEIAILQQAIGTDAEIKEPTSNKMTHYQAIESLKVFSQGLLVPVTSIIDSADKILRDNARTITRSQRTQVEQIRSNAQNIKSWLERVLDTRVDYKKVGPALAQVDLNQIISDAFQDSDRKRLENNQVFKKMIEGVLPPILSDPTALRIAISLLLQKTSDFISPGGTITLEAKLEQSITQTEKIAISINGQNPRNDISSESLSQSLQSDFDLLFAHSLVDMLEGELAENVDSMGAVSFALRIPAKRVEFPDQELMGEPQ
jgi:K+-sensing histidine kinase KdpD